MGDVKIYHNPRCSKSRQVLELIKSNGIEPEIIFYLEGKLKNHDLTNILKLLKMRPIEIIRKNEAEFKEHFHDADNLSDEKLIDLMCHYPKVIERPIVISKGQAIIGRPPEKVFSIL